MSAAAAHPGILADLATIWANWWWAILLFGGSVLEWIGEAFDVGLSALHRRSKRKHKRRLEIKRLELAIAEAKGRPALVLPPDAPAKTPGHCVHRNVSAIVTAADELVGWLCKGCGTRLDPDWAVREEDL